MAETPPSSITVPSCSPLEQEVLDEYVHLLDNLNKVPYSPPISLEHALQILSKGSGTREAD